MGVVCDVWIGCKLLSCDGDDVDHVLHGCCDVAFSCQGSADWIVMGWQICDGVRTFVQIYCGLKDRCLGPVGECTEIIINNARLGW